MNDAPVRASNIAPTSPRTVSRDLHKRHQAFLAEESAARRTNLELAMAKIGRLHSFLDDILGRGR